MTYFIVLAVLVILFFVFLCLVVIWWVYFRGGTKSAELTPVDLEAFENLTDPDEEQFLRNSLSPAEFRRIQRLRIRATELYLAALLHNAIVLIKAGYAAQTSIEPEITAAGLELIHRGRSLRNFCLYSSLRLRAAMAFPALWSPSQTLAQRNLAQRYMVASYMAANLPGRAAA